MFNLTDEKISYILICPETDSVSKLENNWNCERACSVLYSKDQTVFQINEIRKDKYFKNFLGISPLTNNDEIRQDYLHILEFLNLESCVIKYLGDKQPNILIKSGQEKLLTFSDYESKSENSGVYIHEGVTFCLKEVDRYFFPNKKEHLKNGMVVEYFNNNKWSKKEINNLDEEFNKMYKLLMKYNKLRVSSNQS
jgi:hypothetical protein